ncbi:MAG: hypothetical protein AAF677_14985 [Pseudomonadota bacterium]
MPRAIAVIAAVVPLALLAPLAAPVLPTVVHAQTAPQGQPDTRAEVPGQPGSDTQAEAPQSGAPQPGAPQPGAPQSGDPRPETAPDQTVDAAPDQAPGFGSMTVDRAASVLRRLDPEAQTAANGRMVQISVEGTEVIFVSDPRRNRMRLMSRIGPASALSPEQLIRIAQANFDSALDARYAVARGQLWSVYIHPLAEHTEAQLIAAVGQVVNAATSFGTTYSSGLLTFGGGDSNALRQRALIDELLKRGEPI